MLKWISLERASVLVLAIGLFGLAPGGSVAQAQIGPGEFERPSGVPDPRAGDAGVFEDAEWKVEREKKLMKEEGEKRVEGAGQKSKKEAKKAKKKAQEEKIRAERELKDAERRARKEAEKAEKEAAEARTDAEREAQDARQKLDSVLPPQE